MNENVNFIYDESSANLDDIIEKVYTQYLNQELTNIFNDK